ncbi:MAG: hypothetical protein CK425_10410 [Parachlamydia sp.]|nr:MAG: hypothetical protein CK425_10410 [Parachlamydia sp.]
MTHKTPICLLIVSFVLLFACFGQASEEVTGPLAPLIEYLVDIAMHHQQEAAKPVPIVAIGGCPGVGKSYLTHTLINILQQKSIRCTILPLDHFNLSPADRKKIGTEWDIRHFKATKLQQVLQAIFNGQKLIEKPTCNQLTGETGSECMDLNAIDLILFDGLYALCSEAPLNFFDYCFAGVYLETDEANIYKWKWEREQKKMQPRTQEQFASHMQALIEEFQHNIAYSKMNAHFIIQKDEKHQYFLELRIDQVKLN